MKKITLCVIGLAFTTGLSAQTPVPAGEVSGTWTTSGSPYLIQGDILIQAGNTLTIDPGVRVEYQGNYGLNVMGRILAIGSASDSIIFTAADPAIGFNSILYDDPPAANDSSLFDYCSFTYGINTNSIWPYNGGGAFGIKIFSKIRFDHCYFGHNQAVQPAPNGFPSGGAIGLIETDIVIRNCVFESNTAQYGGAIVAYYYSNSSIENCRFIDNMATKWGGGICVLDACSPIIKGNEFIGNHAVSFGGGICVSPFNYPSLYNNPEIEQNLFYNNMAGSAGGAIYISAPTELAVDKNTIIFNQAPMGGGISIYGDANPVISNTILWGNQANSGNQVYLWSDFANPQFLFSAIEGGDTAFGGALFSGNYLFNIDDDPMICDTVSGNFHLNELSPCINAGDTGCVSSNGTRCDMGAYEGGYCPAVGIPVASVNHQAIQIYPVPATDHFNIDFTLPAPEQIRIGIIDLAGNCVHLVRDAYLPAGAYREKVDVSTWSPGIYLCKLQSGRTIFTGKMIKQ